MDDEDDIEAYDIQHSATASARMGNPSNRAFRGSGRRTKKDDDDEKTGKADKKNGKCMKAKKCKNDGVAVCK